ncbi:MAG: hypothetical protein AAGK01_05920 [Pseudomonadota bacterium]
METTRPKYTVALDEARSEFHSSIGGFWSTDSIQEYFDAVNEATMPLLKARSPIYALVDFSDFVPQDRATGDAIRDHLHMSKKYGLKRLAILGASPLTTMQYKRLSDGINVEFFDSKIDAITWLRER